MYSSAEYRVESRDIFFTLKGACVRQDELKAAHRSLETKRNGYAIAGDCNSCLAQVDAVSSS